MMGRPFLYPFSLKGVGGPGDSASDRAHPGDAHTSAARPQARGPGWRQQVRKFTAKQPRPAAARVKLHIAEHYLSENLSDSNTYYEKGRGRAQSAALVEDGKQTTG